MKRTATFRNATMILLLLLLLTACGAPSEPDSDAVPAATSPPQEIDYSKTGTRDHTPLCLVPVAEGVSVFENEVVKVDASHLEEGYVMVQYTGQNHKVKLQITGPDTVTYTYDLKTTDFETFPLSASDGAYHLVVYENIEGKQYATVFSLDLETKITNTFGAFLYPNQYVKFTKENEAVSLAEKLATPADNDLDVVTNVYTYVISHITYDFEKAETVESGYLPDVDNTLNTGKGICLDYASLMTSMLRSQNIPTLIEVGYAREAYHAWLSTYIKDVGWVNGIIKFDGTDWTLMDPTFASTSSEKDLKNFIGDGENYRTKYIY